MNRIFVKVLLCSFIEVSSFFDFVSDMFIVWALSNSTHTSWFTISIFTVLAPYYTIYTSLINHNIKSIRLKQDQNGMAYCSSLFTSLSVLPTVIAILIIIDIIYMCLSVFVYPLLLIISFGKIG